MLGVYTFKPIGGNLNTFNEVKMFDKKYKIIRQYFNDNIPARTIKKGLTKAQAMAHCQDPETSSKTCTSSAGKHRTKVCGPWFDGFDSY